MRVLIACESSGTVRDAFTARGHSAMSCDLLPSETPGEHHTGDVFDVLDAEPWDLLIAHPPCTYLATSGARWLYETPKNPTPGKLYEEARREAQQHALRFFQQLLDADVPRIAVENPASMASTRIRPADQMIHPWQHGHGEMKQTCLWLKNLPPLRPTAIVSGREQRIWKLPPSEDRWRERSRTFPGIAAAMADQWGQLTSVQEVLF